MELATDGDAADCDADSDVLVVEYVSDDETLAPAEKVKPYDENENDSDHVLKVSGDMVFLFCLWAIKTLNVYFVENTFLFYFGKCKNVAI